MYACTYYDLRSGTRSNEISLLFPAWRPDEERVAIISPHDDDAALGAGYLTLAAQEAGAKVWVLICCDGSGGYSTPEQKDTIVQVRRLETLDAHERLGIPPERIIRFDYPDFSLLSHLGWRLPNKMDGADAQAVRALRRIGVTRLLVPNGYREHIDHTAAYTLGAFDAPQAGDPVLADWGPPTPIRSTLVY
ncbi:MAG: PIG-L deacetylase family protein, partial [Burkholderiales bacterium]